MSESDIENLISHVIQHGGNINGIKFKYSEGKGCGVYATNRAEIGQKLISIPILLCISIDTIQSSPISWIIDNHNDLLNYPDELLCLALLHGRSHSESPWYNHIKTIPTSFNLPIFWSKEELDRLENSMVFHLTNLMKKRIERDWENLFEPFSQMYPDFFGGITIEDYTWALAVVYSRAVSFHNETGQYVRCIPPLIDMANHTPESGLETADTINYDPTSKTLIFFNTNKNIAPGMECYANYGYYSNQKLLYSYGFVTPYATPKAIDMWPSIHSQISNIEIKQSILYAHDLTKEQTYDFTGTIRDEGKLTPQLLITLRVLQATKEELDTLNVHQLYQNEIISNRNEDASLASMRDLVLKKLMKDADKAEDDRRALGDILLDPSMKDPPLHDRAFLALVIRVEERELFQECLREIELAINKLKEEINESIVNTSDGVVS